MADPVIVDIPKDTWTKVASGVTSGQIHKLYSQPSGYYHTYRMAGNTPPVNTVNGRKEGVEIFKDNNISEGISNTSAIDIYIWCATKNGKVRVDL